MLTYKGEAQKLSVEYSFYFVNTNVLNLLYIKANNIYFYLNCIYELDVITSWFFFIMFKIFSLNKVNWLPQYYSQYSPRDHFSPSLCYTLLYESCIFVILKAVGEMGWVHLLPVAIKIFSASQMYASSTFYRALSTVGGIESTLASL